MVFFDYLMWVRRRNYRFKSPRVLGRFACLGEDIVTRLGLIRGTANHQKERVDYLLASADDRTIVCRPEYVVPHLAKIYIQGTITQQKFNFFDYTQPDIIVLDSYSELTDQLFIHKSRGWQFCANYTDLDYRAAFDAEFHKSGLMPTEDIERNYRIWFDRLRAKYGAAPIIFIHFPTTLDKREKFKLRGQTILEIMGRLEKEYENLYSVNVADEFVDWSHNESDELRGFPYHYDEKTYAAFVHAISNMELKLPGLG